MQPFRWGSVLIEIDGPTKVNRPETLKDNEGCSFLQVKCKYSSFRRVPLKGRVNQGSAEELIVQSSFFHSCASQVAPSRYSARRGGGLGSVPNMPLVPAPGGDPQSRWGKARGAGVNCLITARVPNGWPMKATGCTAEAPETHRLLMHYKTTKVKAVVSRSGVWNDAVMFPTLPKYLRFHRQHRRACRVCSKGCSVFSSIGKTNLFLTDAASVCTCLMGADGKPLC